MHNAQLDKFV